MTPVIGMNIPSEVSLRDPDITRKCILDAALKLFSQKGYHGTNVPDVAQEAAVGAGSIYRHFEDKQGLVNALYREWKEKFRKEIMIPMPDMNLSFRDQFLELWGRLWRFYRTNPNATVFLDVHAHGDYLRAECRELALRFEEDLQQWIKAGQQEKVLTNAPPFQLIAMVYGSFLGLVKQEQAGRPLKAGEIERSGDLAWRILEP